MADSEEVRGRLDAVIAAMKRAGAWDVQAPPEEAFVDMGPFGMRTLAFEQWLRFVFVPNVERLIASNGPWPSSSQVAVQATREGDGNPVVAELVPALAAFDGLFEPDEGEPSPPRVIDALPPPADDAYARSRAAFSRGDHAAALVAIEEAIAIDPNFPNAHNFAGWVRLNQPSRTTGDLAAAIGHFRAALEVLPSDGVAAANLCDALVAAGREKEAILEAERHGAHNWLGVHWMGSPTTLPRAIAELELAVRSRPRWGFAHANLAKALEVAHRSDEAYAEHELALSCDDEIDRAFSHERRGAYEARRGWQRNALRSFRAALREDRRTGSAREATYREALDWLEGRLRAAGIAYAPPDRELTDEVWQRACELELPPGFGARNEMGEPLADEVIEVERLVRAERWQDVVERLEKLRAADVGKLVDALGYAERGAELAWRAGRRAEALAMMGLVVEGYRAYASWATSGGEGISRGEEVRAKQQKLDFWERQAATPPPTKA